MGSGLSVPHRFNLFEILYFFVSWKDLTLLLCNVYANNDEIACKAGDGKVIASFPDVCLSPPSPPAGPIPVPYPNTSFSKDMKNGSKTVKIKDKEVMLKDKSFYKTSPLGDEAATKSFGAGVVTHVITGKTYFVAWSSDVKIEGQNVDRNMDFTTSNHASPMSNGQPPNVNASGVAKPPPDAECPCCHKKPHANQWDPDTGDMYEEVEELEYYKEGVEHRQNGVSTESQEAFKKETASEMSEAKQEEIIKFHINLKTGAEAAHTTLEDAMNQDPLYPNLHQSGDPCGKHFNKTNPKPKTSKKKARRQLGFSDGVRNECLRRHPNMPDGTPIPSKDGDGKGPGICHKTPLSAGGCPTDQKNLIPKDALTEECKKVDDAQTILQDGIGAARKAARERAGS